MRADFNLRATLRGPDLESGAIGREGVGPWLVDEVDGDEELRRISRTVIGVANGLEANLIPAVRSILRKRIPFAQIFDPVPERIRRFRQTPGEHPSRVVGIPNRGR